MADNIVFGSGVLAHHPEDPSLEFWDFADFHQVFCVSFVN